MKICPFFEEDIGDFWCKVAGVNVKYIEDGDIRICMSERYKECYIASSLQKDTKQKVVVRLKFFD